MKDDLNRSSQHQGVFAAFGRTLGSSRAGQFYSAVIIAALFSGLAVIAWHNPKFAAFVLTVGLLAYGYQLAWKFLPISRATRNRLALVEQLAETHPAGRLSGLLWLGIVLVPGHFLFPRPTEPGDDTWPIGPAILILVGATCYLICWRLAGKTQAALARSRAQTLSPLRPIP